MEGFFKTIQPDDKQKEEIKEILDKYAKLNSDLIADFRKEFDSNNKAMRKELDSKLTKEQLARIKEMDERREEMIRQSRRHRRDSSFDRRPGPHTGPPPPPPPQDTVESFDDK